MIHELKTLKGYFEAQKNGLKNFEFRKDDRDFKVGDTLKLEEIHSEGIAEPVRTGNVLLLRITYILKSNNFNGLFAGIEEGYCVLSTEPI